MNSKPCKACGHPIVFLPAKSGKLLPINAETVQEGDTEYQGKDADGKGKHIAHFATCPEADKFRKKK